MKILGLCGSPRKGGNTETLVTEALAGAKSEGAETELYSLAGKTINPCDGCQSCIKTGKCHQKDDMQEVFQKMVAADGILFGTPVYFYSMAGQTKALIDRTYSIRRPQKQLVNKVGGIIVVAGGIGRIDAVKDLYFYLAINHMVAADYVAATASDRGSVKNDVKYMKAAWELGREMAKLMELKFQFPKEFEWGPGLSSFVSHKYALE